MLEDDRVGLETCKKEREMWLENYNKLKEEKKEDLGEISKGKRVP